MCLKQKYTVYSDFGPLQIKKQFLQAEPHASALFFSTNSIKYIVHIAKFVIYNDQKQLSTWKDPYRMAQNTVFIHPNTILCRPLSPLLPPSPSSFFVPPPLSILVKHLPTLFLQLPRTSRRLLLTHTSPLLSQHFSILPTSSSFLPPSSYLRPSPPAYVLPFVRLTSFSLIFSFQFTCPFFHNPMPFCLPSP